MPTLENNVHRQLLCKMLLYGRLTRRQVGEAFEITMPAVTRYARWLVTHELVCTEMVRLPDIKRPVETFRVNGARGTGLALRISANEVSSQLAGLDGGLLEERCWPVPQPTQICVMRALRRAVAEGRAAAAAKGRRLDLVGISVSGYVEPESGMIFNVRGVADWEPCLPGHVALEMRDVAWRSWTQVASKIEGLTVQMRSDDRIGYIVFADGAFAVATMEHGRLVLGRFGTAGSAVHRQVSADSEECFCGKTGCLDMHLRRGDATPAMVLQALPAVLTDMRVCWLGAEWPVDPKPLLEVCRAAGVEQVKLVGEADELDAMGVRYRCARLLQGIIVDRLRPTVTREVVKPAVFRRPLVIVDKQAQGRCPAGRRSVSDPNSM